MANGHHDPEVTDVSSNQDHSNSHINSNNTNPLPHDLRHIGPQGLNATHGNTTNTYNDVSTAYMVANASNVSASSPQLLTIPGDEGYNRDTDPLSPLSPSSPIGMDPTDPEYN